MATTTGQFGRRPAVRSGAVFPASDLITWGLSSPHQGHRLWANMPVSFWVFVYKVQRCPDPSSHDWRLCPFAHRGERARRRNPRRHPYAAVACPDYRASHENRLLSGTSEAPTCVRGLACGYAHGVFELWLHPERFRTRMCDAGSLCPRSICFFAHHPTQRRREDDPVPFVDQGLRLPPAIPRMPSVSPLPRPAAGMMLQTRSGERLPVHGSDYGASSSSSYTPAVIVADIWSEPTQPIGNGSSSVVGSSSRRGADDDEDSDPFPNFDIIILNVLNSLMLD